jgi:hypothetical protein
MGTAKPARRTGQKGNGRRARPYRFELVPLSKLFVDADYQRPLTSFVETVAREYDPALVGTLIVSERDDGRFAVIDGQTRMEGMGRNEEDVAPCLVYENLTREQEARLFSDLQTKRRGMATYLRFRAALVAKQPEALAIAAIANEEGFDLGVEEHTHTLKSIAALEWCYRADKPKDGEPTGDLLRRVLKIIATAWPDAATEFRTSSDVIRGLGVFLRREKNVDDNRLEDRLAGITPRTLRHRANALQEGSGSGTGGRAAYMADAILGVYMRGGRRRAAA